MSVYLCVCVFMNFKTSVLCIYECVSWYVSLSLSLYLIFASIFVLFSFHILLFFYWRNFTISKITLLLSNSYVCSVHLLGPFIHTFDVVRSGSLTHILFPFNFGEKESKKKTNKRKKLTTMKSAICVCWILF